MKSRSLPNIFGNYQHIDPDRLQSLVQHDYVAAADFDRYRDALARFAAAPEAYTLWLSILVCGEKPHDERWMSARLAAPNPQAAQATRLGRRRGTEVLLEY